MCVLVCSHTHDVVCVRREYHVRRRCNRSLLFPSTRIQFTHLYLPTDPLTCSLAYLPTTLAYPTGPTCQPPLDKQQCLGAAGSLPLNLHGADNLESAVVVLIQLAKRVRNTNHAIWTPEVAGLYVKHSPLAIITLARIQTVLPLRCTSEEIVLSPNALLSCPYPSRSASLLRLFPQSPSWAVRVYSSREVPSLK